MADKTIGSMEIEIRAENKKFKKDIDKLNSQLVKEGKKAGKSFSGGFAKALGALYAFKKAFDFTVQAKNASRDAEETRSKFNTVFSSMAKDANSMASEFAKSFGIANSSAMELLGNTGDLLVGFGFTEKSALDLSLQVNSLAQDLASFTNFSGGAKGASQALTKALLGETESAKSLGIVVRQNTKEFKAETKQLVASGKYTEQQAKSVLILKQMYEQSGKAIGDYARTKNSLANIERKVTEETKSLMEAIGMGLTPAYVGLNKAVLGYLTLMKQILGLDQKSFWNTSDVKDYFKTIEGMSEETLTKEYDAVQKIYLSQVKRINEIQAILKEDKGKGLLNGLSSDELSKLESELNTLQITSEKYSGQLRTLNDYLNDRNKLEKLYGGIVEGSVNAIDKENISMKTKIDLLRSIRDLEPKGQQGVPSQGFNRTYEDWKRTHPDMQEVDVTVAKPLIDAGEQFGGDMLSALGTGQQLASTLQNGLFRAGQGFVDYMGQAIGLASQIVGIVASFTPGGVFASLFSSATATTSQVGVVAPQAASSATQTLGKTSGSRSVSLSDVNNSIMALNKTLVKKDFNPVIVNNMDGESFTEKIVRVNENKLNKQSIKTNDY